MICVHVRIMTAVYLPKNKNNIITKWKWRTERKKRTESRQHDVWMISSTCDRTFISQVPLLHHVHIPTLKRKQQTESVRAHMKNRAHSVRQLTVFFFLFCCFVFILLSIICLHIRVHVRQNCVHVKNKRKKRWKRAHVMSSIYELLFSFIDDRIIFVSLLFRSNLRREIFHLFHLKEQTEMKSTFRWFFLRNKNLIPHFSCLLIRFCHIVNSDVWKLNVKKEKKQEKNELKMRLIDANDVSRDDDMLWNWGSSTSKRRNDEPSDPKSSPSLKIQQIRI